MISGDIIKTLDLLPNEELSNIQCYINDLKNKRKEERGRELAKRINEILDEAQEAGFSIGYTTHDDCFNLKVFCISEFQ